MFHKARGREGAFLSLHPIDSVTISPMQMGESLRFRLILLGMLILFVAHRAYYTSKQATAQDETIEHKEIGLLRRRAAGFVLVALISTGIYLFKPDWLAWASIPLLEIVRWFGAALAIVGFALLQWSQASLGQQWSDRPQIAADHQLIQHGPYQWVRHPIYTSFLLILSAPLFIVAYWLLGSAWILGTALDIATRTDYEEEKLEAVFGEEYCCYRERTGALLPRV